MMRLAAGSAAAPDAQDLKVFRSGVGLHVLVAPHTRIFDVAPDFAIEIESDAAAARRIGADLGRGMGEEADLSSVALPAPQSLSLNVSSSCNLACGYCYAGRGSFEGRQTATMARETGFAAVDRLLSAADPARPVTIGFLGGEPLLNRTLVHAVVAHAERLASRRAVDVRFSITTNGTLVSPADIALFRDRPFAVTVSIDGGQTVHDAQRPLARGAGSFARLARQVGPLLEDPGQARLSARLTVRPPPGDLAERLAAVWDLGFAEAGVAPLRVAPGEGGFADADWGGYLAELIAVSRGEFGRARHGLPIRLTNFAVALKQLAAGASSPFPCGAGGGYFSVAADGDWYACHRAIGLDEYRLGDAEGLDEPKRLVFLTRRHVDAKTDCRMCWARYLCSGGCHQESAARSPSSCDFIRTWLEFCLASYCELTSPPLQTRPM